MLWNKEGLKQMKLRVLEIYGGIGRGARKPGTIVDLPSGLAETWIKSKWGELVTESPKEKLVPIHARREKMKIK